MRHAACTWQCECRSDDDSAEAEPSTSSVPDYLPSGAQDWREFRARLVASAGRNADAGADAASDMWAHHVPVPEQVISTRVSLSIVKAIAFLLMLGTCIHDRHRSSCQLRSFQRARLARHVLAWLHRGAVSLRIP